MGILLQTATSWGPWASFLASLSHTVPIYKVGAIRMNVAVCWYSIKPYKGPSASQDGSLHLCKSAKVPGSSRLLFLRLCGQESSVVSLDRSCLMQLRLSVFCGEPDHLEPWIFPHETVGSWASRDLCNGARKWSWAPVLAEKFVAVMAQNKLLVPAYCHRCLWNSLIHGLQACPILNSSSNWRYLFKTRPFSSQMSGCSLSFKGQENVPESSTCADQGRCCLVKKTVKRSRVPVPPLPLPRHTTLGKWLNLSLPPLSSSV